MSQEDTSTEHLVAAIIKPVSEDSEQERYQDDAKIEPKASPNEMRDVFANVFASTGRNVLQVKRLSENATVPTRATDGSAGYDLASAKDVILPARGKVIVPTDLAMRVSSGHYGRIAPRSGFSWKNHVDVAAGVVDSD
jgi:hypothetical protein